VKRYLNPFPEYVGVLSAALAVLILLIPIATIAQSEEQIHTAASAAPEYERDGSAGASTTCCTDA
jgi:hypothetical protein